VDSSNRPATPEARSASWKSTSTRAGERDRFRAPPSTASRMRTRHADVQGGAGTSSAGAEGSAKRTASAVHTGSKLRGPNRMAGHFTRARPRLVLDLSSRKMKRDDAGRQESRKGTRCPSWFQTATCWFSLFLASWLPKRSFFSFVFVLAPNDNAAPGDRRGIDSSGEFVAKFTGRRNTRPSSAWEALPARARSRRRRSTPPSFR